LVLWIGELRLVLGTSLERALEIGSELRLGEALEGDALAWTGAGAHAGKQRFTNLIPRRNLILIRGTAFERVSAMRTWELGLVLGATLEIAIGLGSGLRHGSALEGEVRAWTRGGAHAGCQK
jgi:hypothetical protein